MTLFLTSFAQIYSNLVCVLIKSTIWCCQIDVLFSIWNSYLLQSININIFCQRKWKNVWNENAYVSDSFCHIFCLVKFSVGYENRILKGWYLISPRVLIYYSNKQCMKKVNTKTLLNFDKGRIGHLLVLRPCSFSCDFLL